MTNTLHDKGRPGYNVPLLKQIQIHQQPHNVK